jgi:hypothetical protein
LKKNYPRFWGEINKIWLLTRNRIKLIFAKYKIMKIIFTLISLLLFTFSFSQWTRVEQLPSSDIFTLYHKDSIFYAGGKKIIYVSRNKGQTWDSTTAIPQLSFVNNIIVYKNELYATAPHAGVFKSPDGGITWQNISAGIFPDVADFCEYRGDLYAATFGSSVYKLNPATGNSWVFFSTGLSDFSANLPTIASNSNAIIAGTLGNGIYDYLPANSTTWEERLLAGQLDPGEGAYDIVTGHDTLFYSGRTGKFYMSTNNGLTWNFIGNRLTSFATTMVNAKQAVLVSRRILENGSFKILFYYIKKDALQDPFVNFSIVPDHFTYRMDILGDKLWDASDRGLFYMSLSDLPGISSAEDSAALIPLPLRYVSFDAQLKANATVDVQWKTADEFNIDHFEVERSANGSTWNTLVNIFPQSSNQYHYTDASPQQGENFYRVKAVGKDGKFFYTIIKSIIVGTEEKLFVSPNPAHDIVNLTINTGNESQVVIKVFDNKGALIKMQKATVLPGNNQLRLDIGSLANGIYSFHAEWNNGQMKKTVRVIKQ